MKILNVLEIARKEMKDQGVADADIEIDTLIEEVEENLFITIDMLLERLYSFIPNSDQFVCSLEELGVFN